MGVRTGGRWLLAAALALVLAAVVVSTPFGREPDGPLARKGLIVGVVANTLDDGLGRAQDRVRETGVRWIREELRWDVVEAHEGHLDWRTSDALFASASARGLHVLPLLLGTPAWAGRHGALPRDQAAFGRFTAAAARRYGPGGRFWRDRPADQARTAPVWFEVWNEPWFRAFSTGGVSPRTFARLAHVAVRAGRRANPHTRWLLPIEGRYERDDGAIGNWIDDLAAARKGLGDEFDAFSVHPYATGDPRSRDGDSRGQFRRIDGIRDSLREHGWATNRLWITEIGWSTCARRPGCVSEADQRRYLTTLFSLLRDEYADSVQAVFLYRLGNIGTPKPQLPQLYYGVVRHDGSHKPAYDVLVRATRDAARP